MSNHRLSLLFLAGLLFLATEKLTCETISLDGDWNFVADPPQALDITKLSSAQNIRPTRVPSSWQSQFDDLRDYAGVAWYWRTVSLERLLAEQIVLLRFAAVDYLAEVYVNGQKVGSHEGGYLPFEFDITSQVRNGENQIAVRVVDPGPNSQDVEGLRYAEIPHGKQNWYVQTSGLWQSVELDFRPRMHLGNVHVSAAADGNFRIEAPIVNIASPAPVGEPGRATAKIFDPDGKPVWEESQNLKAGEGDYTFTGRLSNPKLWSPSNPSLYRLNVWLSSGDTQDYRFGFRTFEARGGKFYLNGRIIYLRGALDQAFYPETFYTPPSLEYLRNEMGQARMLGLNLLRCHIKVPDPRYLEAADDVGMLIWYEIPNWDKLTDDAKRRAMATLRGMVERDWNHPSIVLVSIINESWGANLKELGDREWLKRAYGEAKKLVPGWLVVDNSACCENFHLATDVADFHHYSAIPDHAADFDRLVDELARRPGWLFSPYGDATPRGDEPLVLSEFGNWGLPKLPETKPWWFARDYKGIKMTVPEGAENRFGEYRYGSLFADFNALVEATEWNEYRALKYEIESLRARPDVQGYVITEFTDVNWESNGLLSMWRRPKVFNDLLRKLQADDVVIVRPENRNFATGDKVQADVFFSHYSFESMNGAEINWSVEGTALRGSFALPPVSPGTAVKAGRIEFIAPSTEAPSKLVLEVRATSGTRTIAENSVDLFIYPPKVPELPPAVSLYDPGGRLRRLVNEMHARNYQEPTGREAFPLLITSSFDEHVKQTLERGGRVILIANDRLTLAPGLEVVPRGGSRLDGNWISNFLWIRKDKEPFRSVSFGTMAGFETQAVAPSAVLQGVPPEHFDDVLAGIFYGWIHSNVGTLVQAKCGKGKLLICTFSLGTTYGTDPYANYLLDALVNYAVSGPTPNFEIPLR